MRTGIFAALAVLAALGSACRRHDYRTLTITVPEMRDEACAKVVRRAVQSAQGVLPGSVTADPAARTVTVTYDSLLLSLRNIQFEIADAGFRADDVPADEAAAAKLPAECR